MAPTAPLNLGILASGKGSNFAAIAQSIRQGRLQAQIRVLIYNNPQAGVRHQAQTWDVPAVLLDHRQFPDRASLDRAIVGVLQAHGAELVVMAGWMRLVTVVLLEQFQVINIHPSLLPSFKGAQAIEQALNYGVKITGCTVHLVELAVDSGVILAQQAVSVLPGDTPASLGARIQCAEHQLLPEVLQHFARGQFVITDRQAIFN
ncbi:phosphoribosylglycinamide formyltransferase [Candidatus Cyanaurora vandensis]|uniref:phosphoribosylglycinamide formyltransferase n=1 Tax=Candidatus Cyanaurora vandensis TaxID=2714958 RepID=UPI00257C6315|nr:phosphoribosylglycinamide formyltransferase [Candidatus Cyanaurora vandensis]